jgi:predicted short-subunit dehydrogenase-like oxidoreductase (DUF2520 family)
MKIGIIGAGRAGVNFAKLLVKNKHEVCFYDASLEQLELAKSCMNASITTSLDTLLEKNEWIVLSVPDDLIVTVYSLLPIKSNNRGIIHLSGALNNTKLRELNPQIQVVGIHPIRAFASIYDDVSQFDHTFFGVEATEELYKYWLDEIPSIKNRMIRVKAEDKVIYHAAAVTASNYIVTVLHQAVSLYTSIGFDENKAKEIAVSLAKTAVANVEKLGTKYAQTGPLYRGDVDTVKKHLNALSGNDLEFYTHLAKATHLSYQQQLTKESKLAIQQLINKE